MNITMHKMMQHGFTRECLFHMFGQSLVYSACSSIYFWRIKAAGGGKADE